MEQNFKPVTSIDAFDRLVERSADEPVVLFKHDTTCPISAAAYREMSQMPDDIALVDVGRDNDMAQEIAARTGIEHASPQVIVFNGSQATWSASLYDITHEAVAEALQP